MEPRPSSRSFSRLQRLTSDSGESEYRPRPRRFGDAPPFSGDAVAVASSTAASSVACTSLEISVDVVDTADARAAAGTAPDETVDDPALDAAAAWAFTAAAYSGVGSSGIVSGKNDTSAVASLARKSSARGAARALALALASDSPPPLPKPDPPLSPRRCPGFAPAAAVDQSPRDGVVPAAYEHVTCAPRGFTPPGVRARDGPARARDG